MMSVLWDKIKKLAIMKTGKMEKEQYFEQELLIMGLLSTDHGVREEAKNRLERLYGPSRYAGPTLPFIYTDYYNREMGNNIERDFLAFETLVDPSRLAEIKTVTNELEQEYTVDGRRRINIDPGLLSLGKLILASTKDNAQRIPLSLGIYGEITLIFRQKSYRPERWTYPDYRSTEYLEIFHALREDLKKKLQD
ncbi:MAG: DUF4416 family protein [Spirochaetia bacterium]